MYDLFIAECKKEMHIRKMRNKELAAVTGYKKSTIDAFFADLSARDRSDNVAAAISKALDIRISQK